MADLSELYHLFSLPSAETYEPFDRMVVTDEYLSVVQPVLPADWELIRAKPWFTARSRRHALPDQGWKIHVSSSLQDAPEVLRRTVAICTAADVSFKFALDRSALVVLNSKGWSRAQCGKFITIYPTTTETFMTLLDALRAALKDFEGPFVLSDRRYKDARCVYYRYGGITGRTVLTHDGQRSSVLEDPTGALVPDLRQTEWMLPDWVESPILEEEGDEDENELLNGRYLIESALSFSVNGGVYLALDTVTDALVVIKEARPHVSPDPNGDDAVARLTREHRLLRQLNGASVFPEAIDFFHEWEHVFLVESYVPGMHLGRFTTTYNPVLTNTADARKRQAFTRQLLGLWLTLARAVATVHDRGIVIGDLSTTNVIVVDAEAGDLRLIDLDGGWQEGHDRPATLRTRGFTSPQRLAKQTATRADDLYALGAVLLASIFPNTALAELQPGHAETLLLTLGQELPLPAAVHALILALLQDDPAERPTAQRVAEVLAACRNDPPVRPERPALLPDVSSDSVIAHLLGSADIHRRDRLFPPDPRGYFSHPLNVAYGAAGVAHALHHVRGAVPAQVRAWMLSHPVRPEQVPPGLYIGSAGIAWVCQELGWDDLALRLIDQAHDHPLKYRQPDVYSGTAGYGLASLHLHRQLGRDVDLQHAVDAGDQLLRISEETTDGRQWAGANGSVTAGYAHGTSGIAHFLLLLSRASGDDRFLKAGLDAMRFCTSALHTFDHGGMGVLRGDQDRSVVSHYWLNGSAGVASVYLRYWQATGDPAMLQTAEQILVDVRRKYTLFPGLFQGMAGLGETLLDAYDLIGTASYLEAARQIREGLRLYALPRPGGLAFPGEQLYRLSSDLGTGSAGVALFLHRLEHAAEHPGSRNFMIDGLLPARAARPEPRSIPMLAADRP